MVMPQGHVYVGMPPLYKVEVGRRSSYCYDDAGLAVATRNLTPGSYHIQRFKVAHKQDRHEVNSVEEAVVHVFITFKGQSLGDLWCMSKLTGC